MSVNEGAAGPSGMREINHPEESVHEENSAGVATIGVVGAGLMGAGIAQVAAAAGFTVLIHDSAEGASARALESIEGRYRRLQDKGRMDTSAVEGALGRLGVASTLEDLAGCDAVIEAVIEDLAVKQDVFERLGHVVGDHVILATNTSALPVTDIAARCCRPGQVVGMHFFSPVPAMRLCEVVRGYRTTDTVLEGAVDLAHRLGKETIVVSRDDAGFVTSRLMTVLVQEAARIVEEGLATPEDVDRACELGFGHRMGPLATTDLTGVDVAYRAGRSIFEATGDPAFRPPQILRRMVAAGALGRKSGEGFYQHDADRS